MMIVDAAERRRAVLTADHAFVWASAGTGKTHTLTLRALYLLLTMPFPPAARKADWARLYTAKDRAERLRAARAVIRRLVLTTFTRKAAAEMQTRLYEYLDALANAADLAELEVKFGANDPQLIELVQCVLENLRGTGDPFARLTAGARGLAELATELQVCTLHSFAAAILRRHPVAAGIPPAAQFAEEDDTTALDPAAALVDRWWQHVGRDPVLSGQLAGLLAVVPLADMQPWLAAIVEHPWIVEETAVGPPAESAVKEIHAACRALAVHPQAGRLKLVTRLAGVVNSPQFSWEKLASFLGEEETRTGLFLDRLKSDKSKNLQAAIGALPASQRRWFASWLTMYPPVLAKCLATEQAGHWRQWREFLQSFAVWAEGATVRELALVTFADMVRLAVKLLATNDTVRREERERLGALLVDEFQDTDPVQLALLGHLVRRDSARDHEVLGFFVGDAKQSIYRFRHVDLPAITHFVAGYAAHVKAPPGRVGEFRLTASFRSLPPITDFVNELFATRLPLPEYEKEKLVPVRTGPGPVPEWRLLAAVETAASVAAKRELVAWETARLIDEYLQGAPAGARGYQDVVVLVNTHDELDALLPVLEQVGIPAVSSGAKTFYQHPEVLDVLNLLIALHNPQDALAVGALLRSPLGGLADAAIYRLLRAVPTGELVGGNRPLPADLPVVAAARIAACRQLFGDRTRCALADWLRQVREFIPGGVYGQQDAEGRAVVRIEQVLAAFGRVRQLGMIPPLVWLLEQRRRADRSDAFDADLGEDISVTDESVAAVRVMTIHKAKGLQGRFVIVAGWQQALQRRRERRKRRPIISLTGPDGRAVAGFRLPWGPLEIVSARYAEADALDRRNETEEGVRLAYVAATRARDRLVLLSPDLSELEGGILAGAVPPVPEQAAGPANGSRDARSPTTGLEGERLASRSSTAGPRSTNSGSATSQEGNREAVLPSTGGAGGGFSESVRSKLIENPLSAGRAPVAVWDGTLRVAIVRPRRETPRRHRETLPIADPAAYARCWQDRAAVWRRPAEPLLHRPSQPEQPAEEAEVEPTDYVGGRGGAARATRRAAGTLLHRYLEKHLLDGSFEPGKLQSLSTGDPSDPRPGLAATKAAEALRAFFGSAAHDRARAARVLGREVPVYLTEGGQAWNGVLDLVLEADGQVIGVDYKLLARPAEMPAAYRQQQRIYQEALRRLFPDRPVSFEFWWLGTEPAGSQRG